MFSCLSGQTDKEGGRDRKVRNPLRRFPPENGEEDGDHATLEVHLHLLRQGENDAFKNIL